LIKKSEPFNVTDEQKGLLIARYLVEDNNEDFVDLDLDRTQNIPTARSIFKKLVGSYTILEPVTEA